MATSTLDGAGDVVATYDMAGVSLGEVRAAAAAFVGDIEQVPPMVSAVKVGGRRLHELARAGVEVERAPRRVTVTRLDVEEGPDPGTVRIAVDCSSGTYVRTLAADLGTALGGGAHLRRLRRTAVGPFTVDMASSVEDLSPATVLPPAAALSGYPQETVDDDTAAAVAHGAVLDDRGWEGEGPWAVLDLAGELLAVYERRPDGRVKPQVVMAG